MDNVKTGALIREARTARGMTQKQLAEALNITDRAVSKWERGLSAPDIALLEPLAEALGVTVLELIRGEHDESAAPEADAAVRETLDYSRAALHTRLRRLNIRHLRAVILALLIIAAAAYYVLVVRGAAFVVDRVSSPDGASTAVIYDRHVDHNGLDVPQANSVTVLAKDEVRSWYAFKDGLEINDVNYIDSAWSPDGEKFVLVVEGWAKPGITSLWLYREGGSQDRNFYFNLAHGLYVSELARYGFKLIEYDVDVNIYFVQWAADSESMLLYYTFPGVDGIDHDGYFWYDCTSGEIKDIYELH